MANLGMSTNFGDVDLDHLTFPAVMLIDYVRVYQVCFGVFTVIYDSSNPFSRTQTTLILDVIRKTSLQQSISQRTFHLHLVNVSYTNGKNCFLVTMRRTKTPIWQRGWMTTVWPSPKIRSLTDARSHLFYIPCLYIVNMLSMISKTILTMMPWNHLLMWSQSPFDYYYYFAASAKWATWFDHGSLVWQSRGTT